MGRCSVEAYYTIKKGGAAARGRALGLVAGDFRRLPRLEQPDSPLVETPGEIRQGLGLEATPPAHGLLGTVPIGFLIESPQILPKVPHGAGHDAPGPGKADVIIHEKSNSCTTSRLGCRASTCFSTRATHALIFEMSRSPYSETSKSTSSFPRLFHAGM